MPLHEDDVRELIGAMWQTRVMELPRFDRFAGYVEGSMGRPEIPATADADIKDIASMCVKNVIAPVVDSFAQNLSVVGYRRAGAETDVDAWARWQAQRLDARQDEVHRYVHTYGIGYATVLPGDTGPQVRYRSPRRMFTVYDDPMVDQWPMYALETWTARGRDGKRVVEGYLYDDEHAYPLLLGNVVPGTQEDKGGLITLTSGRIQVGKPIPHGAPGHVPVVRFIGSRDADGMPVGEVEPLIDMQRAINSINFDRMIVSRFGAFPKNVITGWAGGQNEVLAASARRFLTFEDPDVKAQTLMGADGRAYNELVTEMMEHVAMIAKLSPAEITGKMINLSAEALAAGEKTQQRKLARLKESLGESHEAVIRLMAHYDGDTEGAADMSSEVVWDDTEARSFGAIVDGVTKLAQAGLPLTEMLTLIPGLTQSQRESIKRKMAAGGEFESVLQQIMAPPPVVAPEDDR